MKYDNLQECLDDLAVRFLIYLSPSETASFSRLGFHVEQAHWFYTDMSVPHNPTVCPPLPLRTFAPKLLARLDYSPAQSAALLDRFLEYKGTVPVCGCILVNESAEKVLMVRGWSGKAKWGFPRGKISKDEAAWDCARRECLEECGYPPEAHSKYIEVHLEKHPVRLYVVAGVDEQFPFAPQTRNEIGAIAWHFVKDLPDRKGHPNAKYYFNVLPFVKKLKSIIGKKPASASRKLSIGELMKAAISKSSENLNEEPDDHEENDDPDDIVDIIESDESELLDDGFNQEINFKPVWVGKETADTADLLAIFKGTSAAAREPPAPVPSDSSSTKLLSLLTRKKPEEDHESLIPKKECLRRIEKEIPEEGLTNHQLKIFLSSL